MYEPIRTKSVHTVAGTTPDFPHRSREEELDIQLAGHLAALLAVTDELRALEPSAELDRAAERLVQQVTRLRWGSPLLMGVPPLERSREWGSSRELGEGASPVRAAPTARDHEPHAAELHRRAHALAGRALVVAASRADTAAAILSAQCMDAHAAATSAELSPAG
ncbi:hypothetical protein ABT173_03900 [Streptomyces sp. NPDC001795]|uniref:SCO4983 family protein n=1 Tax=unclassified Streptomyces TaxID=2593676 RepID=UPI00331DD6DA